MPCAVHFIGDINMAKKLTKSAAQDAGNALDRAADLLVANADAFGIKGEIAQKFAFQCDLLSDHIAKRAGVDVTRLEMARKQGLTGDSVFNEGVRRWNPEEIGKEVSGPLEQDADEPYMNGEFTQQEHRELRDKQEKGELSSGVITPEPRKPTPGVQATLETGKKLASLYLNINDAATRLAASEHDTVRGLGSKLASVGLDVLQFQTRVLEGRESSERVAALTLAAGHVLPHLAGDVPVVAVDKLGRMTDIFAGIARSA